MYKRQVEYHRDSEVDIAVDDLILILGKQDVYKRQLTLIIRQSAFCFV